MHELSDSDRQRLIKAIESNRKVFAVKIYKDVTGVTLAEAKSTVEELTTALRQDDPDRFSPEYKADESMATDGILEFIFRGQKLDAVKQYKESTGCSLAEAKEFVEELTAKLYAESPEQFQPVSKSGCGLVLLGAIGSMVWLLV